jgi:hypothetical protein
LKRKNDVDFNKETNLDLLANLRFRAVPFFHIDNLEAIAEDL